MEHVHEFYKYFKAAMPAMDVASWLGFSGLVEALSVTATIAGTGFGLGSIFLGIGALIGAYGIYQGSTDIGNSSQTLAQSIAKDISNITSFAMETAWPQISKTLQKFDDLMDSFMVMTYIEGIILCTCAAVWTYWQYKKILHDNRLRWWQRLIPARLRSNEDTKAADLMKYAIYLLCFLILILLVLLFFLIPKVFVIAMLTGCIILIAHNLQLHVVTCRFLKQVAYLIYAQNIPNHYISILAYDVLYLLTLYLVQCVLHHYMHQLQTSFLLCLLFVCMARLLTSILTTLYYQVM